MTCFRMVDILEVSTNNHIGMFATGRMCPMFLFLQSKHLGEHVESQDRSLLVL